MSDYLPLPCPGCGTPFYQDRWMFGCQCCGSTLIIGRAKFAADADAAYLAACEIINRSRMIPVEEAVPGNDWERDISLSGEQVIRAEFRDGNRWHCEYGYDGRIIGWWLRPDESADLRISGILR